MGIFLIITLKKNTILLVSHSMEDIAKHATKAMVMNHSKLVAYDTVENVFSRSKELSDMGLAVPQISRVFMSLGETYKGIDNGIFTVESAKEAILKKLRKEDI